MNRLLLSLLLGATAMAQTTYTRRLELDPPSWSASASPEYYRGEGLQNAVDSVEDPERGQVLRWRFGFADPQKSEPAFLTRTLDPQPPRLDVAAVRFRAKLSAPLIDPKGGFILRLRTSDTAHDNWDVQELLGKPFPVGEWVEVEIDTRPTSRVRNIWSQVFGNIREITFRLDDIDELNGAGELLLDGVELVLSRPPEDAPYTPTIVALPRRAAPRVLILRHAAAGYYRLAEAFRAVEPAAEIEEFLYRGLHFEFFGLAGKAEDFRNYDAVVLLDIDPFVLTVAQAQGIADAVASGASLLCFGGATSFSDAKALPNPLREALPIRFALGDSPSTAIVSPVPGEPHPLNQGFDRNWLGQVARRQPLVPKPGTVVPWTAGDLPLVVDGTFHQGRTVVVNAQCQPLRLGADDDLFRSPLGDDFVRRLAAYALRREPEPGIRTLRLDAVPVGGGTIAGLVAGGPEIRVSLAGKPVAVAADGAFALTLPPPRLTEETHLLRLEAWQGNRRIDWRDLPLVVRHPLDLQVVWTRNRSTFEPTGNIDFRLVFAARDVPLVTPGPRTELRYLNRWPVTVDSFVDVWLRRDGQGYHNQAGPVEVETTTTPGIRPAFRTTGVAQAARPAEQTTYAADPRVLDCARTVQCLADGVVVVDTGYTLRQDLDVQRLPLTVSLPVGTYAGLPYRLHTAAGISEGVFPAEPQNQRLFDAQGATLEILTPDGPIRLGTDDPDLRVWCQDLRPHNMSAFRIEIESPIVSRLARQGETYRIPLRIQGPVPAGGGDLAGGSAPTLSASLQDPRGKTWVIPPVPESDGSRYATALPNLPPGHYRLVAAASLPGIPLVTAQADCFVVESLPAAGFYPLACFVDLLADGHCLDPEGVAAHLRDIREAGFNTAAITSPAILASETPSPGRDLRAHAERVATQLGMAVMFEYSSYTTFRSNATPTPCPFTPAGREAVHNHLAPLLDIANRTPRLLTAKVLDEPHLGPEHMDWDCPHCQAEFERRYGIPLAATKDSQEPYALWTRADFVGQVAEEIFRLGAAEKAAGATGTWELLLTYMAVGLGYQRPQRSVQDALDWSRHAGWIDFDIYPYFYPSSQRVRMVQASYGMSYMREVARARRKPWGFYVELDDRNWPFQQNPPEASAECAFTAVLHGADYLNTFIHRLAATGCGARPERWALAREAFQRIGRLGPTLAATPALRSRLAVLHPNAHEMIRNGYNRPDHLLELLKGVFGDLDVLPEQIVQESGTIPYAGLFLLDAEFLHAEAVGPLRKWLDEGGVLYCDRLPTRTHRDQPIQWTGLGEPQTGVHGLRLRAWGKGQVVFLPENPEPILQELAEAKLLDPPALAEKLRILAEQIEATIGPMPLRISSRDMAGDGRNVDTVVAGLRGSGGQRLLTVVNHRDVPVEATLRFTDRTWRYRDAIDPRQPVADQPGKLVLQLPPRGYRVLAGQPR